MQLSHIALIAVKGLMPGINPKLMTALGASEASIYRYVAENNDNLTKAAVLKVIREETGLSNDQILAESKEVAQ